MTTIYLASDHGGFELKEKIKKLRLANLSFSDLGPENSNSVDYPDFANLVAQAVTKNPNSFGILICGSGQGMAIRANKFSNIRAALVWNEASTLLSRQHNNANVLCLGGRLLDHELALKLVELFLTTEFEGGRHQQRIEKLSSKTVTE